MEERAAISVAPKSASWICVLLLLFNVKLPAFEPAANESRGTVMMFVRLIFNPRVLAVSRRHSDVAVCHVFWVIRIADGG